MPVETSTAKRGGGGGRSGRVKSNCKKLGGNCGKLRLQATDRQTPTKKVQKLRKTADCNPPPPLPPLPIEAVSQLSPTPPKPPMHGS